MHEEREGWYWWVKMEHLWWIFEIRMEIWFNFLHFQNILFWILLFNIFNNSRFKLCLILQCNKKIYLNFNIFNNSKPFTIAIVFFLNIIFIKFILFQTKKNPKKEQVIFFPRRSKIKIANRFFILLHRVKCFTFKARQGLNERSENQRSQNVLYPYNTSDTSVILIFI